MAFLVVLRQRRQVLFGKKRKKSKTYIMYTKPKFSKTSIRVNNSYIGETIENKVYRVVNNKEPINDGAPIIYTERKDGVQPQFDIRTDRFEIAVDMMNKETQSHIAKREERIKSMTEDLTKKNVELSNEGKGGFGGPESIQGTK